MSEEQRILALNIHPHSFGFVVFEGAETVLDWGGRCFRCGAHRCHVPFRAKVSCLIDQHVPDAVVLQRPRTGRLTRLVTTIKTEAKAQRVAVRLIDPRAIEQAFLGRNANKNQVASAIAERFPELLYELPPRRRAWQSEDYRMSIFDAAAVGITYFAHKRRPSAAVPPG
jgi:hypothetical protein